MAEDMDQDLEREPVEYDNPEAILANELGKIAWYHNTKTLATAHSLGMMPDYLRGRISFNPITGLVRVRGLTASKDYTRERIKDTNPEWDVCVALLKHSQIRAEHLEIDPTIHVNGTIGRIFYNINRKRFDSLWDDPDFSGKSTALAYFNKQTGLMKFEGLDFNFPPMSPRVKGPGNKDEQEFKLWGEFQEWRAKYRHSAFITKVWEPLETLHEKLEFGVVGKDEIIEVVSTAIKQHYKLIALFRTLSKLMSEDSWLEEKLEDEEDAYGFNPFAVIKARLGEVTGFDGFYPLKIATLSMMLSNWMVYFQDIKKSMRKLVEEFCPEAPQIARYLLQKDQGITVQLEAGNFCPWLYHDEACKDPYLNSMVWEEGESESSDSWDEMVQGRLDL